MRNIVLHISAALAVMVLQGCEEAPRTGSAPRVEPGVEQPASISADDSASAGDTAPAAPQRAEANVADDIPMYPEAAWVAGSSGGRQTAGHWTTPASHAEVMGFYATRLPEEGWSVENTLSFGRIEASKDRRKLTVDIARGTDPPTKILMVEIRPE